MDSKPRTVQVPTPHRGSSGSSRKPSWTRLLVAASLSLIALRSLTRGKTWIAPRETELVVAGGKEESWVDIKPSRRLAWQECFGQYDCARLDMPMDWQDPTDEQRVTLAIMRLRAANTTDYKGPVFFNPGGPGGSGVWALRDHGDLLQKIVGDNHDIISFDPRGSGVSVPRLTCWDTIQSRQIWGLQDVGLVDAHSGILYDAFARATAFSKACEANLEESGALYHSSTNYHARDMLEILDQMGEDKLKFWGFSYGTILGGTFAAMYPDRVGRLVSDGNVDYEEWYHHTHMNFARDTDKVMDSFYQFCHLAGPSKCALYAPSPENIKKRLDQILASLKVNPIIVTPSAQGPDLPEMVTYSKVIPMIQTMLYQPVRMFEGTAEVLAALESGDGLPFYERRLGHSRPSSMCSITTVPPTVPPSSPREDTDDAFPCIMCSDGEPLTDDVEEFSKYAEQLQEICTSTPSVQLQTRMSCAGRTVRPKWAFDGPFGGNTSFPILFVANIADNVTPLISARNNSASFPGSVVLVQNSYGHTTLSAASTCTAKYIHDYFQEGSLPLPDTVCEPDVYPFGVTADARGVAVRQGSTADQDSELSRAIQKLSQEANWSGLFTP